jgi:beta-N-acetylhexosaminidase
VLTAAAGTPSPQAMTARELAGQRVAYGFAGTSAPAGLLRLIHRGELAGVTLYARNISSRTQVRRLVRRLQRARPVGAPPLLVMVDQEGGLVKRLPGAPDRSAAAIGATNRRTVAMHAGAATGRNLRGVGMNVDLAPVLEVARRGTIMYEQRRAFGAKPKRVTRMAGAFAAGLRSRRVTAVAKHFPGLGRARGEQDRQVNTIGASRRALRRVDEAPYRGLHPRLRAVMVGSAVYTALDPGTPALFSRRIATAELRDRAGFKGMSMSDALNAPSLLSYGSVGRRAVRSARAGVDLLTFTDELDGAAARRALTDAIAAGRVSRAAGERSAARVLELRAGIGRSR